MLLVTILLFVYSNNESCYVNSLTLQNHELGRRTALVRSAGKAGNIALTTSLLGIIPPLASAAPPSSIASRFETPDLVIQSPSRNSEINGVDNMFFPSWLEGEWVVKQTLVDTFAPQGLRFVGGPSGDLSIANKSMQEQRSKIGIPVNLKIRFVKTKWGVVEDRVFNLRERLDGFAGRSVVASVEYADVGGSNRASVLALGGTDKDPLQTSVVRFKGPAAQKTFLVAHGGEASTSGNTDTWAGFEMSRSIFALTNQSTAPPITVDTEVIWLLNRAEVVDENPVVIEGKLRLVDYLNAQSDVLYFEAKNRAVSISDYVLEFRKI